MKHTVQLYEFMPYGAPELLESRQRHMGRALLLSSGALLLLLAIVGAVAPLLGTTKPAPVILPVEIMPQIKEHRIDPPKPIAPPLPHPTPQAHSPVAKPAIPVPVPDAAPTPIETPTPTPSNTDAGPAIPSGPSTGTTTGVGDDALPSPDAPTYVEQLPTVVKSVKPIYPTLPKEAGIEGLVVVKVLVGKDGHVLDVLLSDKIQVPMLNEAALTAARQWMFTPGMDNGRAVACWITIPFRFRLH